MDYGAGEGRQFRMGLFPSNPDDECMEQVEEVD
jgi:hypothetical protein